MYTLVDGDDWVGLYKDGKLIAEDHELDVRTIFRVLGVELKCKEADIDWLNSQGSFPENLSEVVGRDEE